MVSLCRDDEFGATSTQLVVGCEVEWKSRLEVVLLLVRPHSSLLGLTKSCHLRSGSKANNGGDSIPILQAIECIAQYILVSVIPFDQDYQTLQSQLPA